MQGSRALFGPIEVLILAWLLTRGIIAAARGTRVWNVWRLVNNIVMQSVAIASGLAVCVVLGLLLGYVVLKGIHGLNLDLFTHLPKPAGMGGGGLKNAIVGTLELVAIASIIGIPVGLIGGIFISEYKESKFAAAIRFGADVLNGVPSVVVGLFAYSAFVLPFKHFSALAGGGALAVIMIPTIVRITEEMLRLVPEHFREASLGLGAGRTQTILKIVVPSAKKGIITGVMLAIARVAGETAPLLFTAFGSEQLVVKPTEPISSLTLKIYNYAQSPYEDWVQQAWAGALVLLLMIVAISLAARLLTRPKLA
jgi:phosphate transport system permease protein